MENQQKNPNLEQVFGEAEETLRKGFQTLSDWGEQARNVMQNRPGIVIASLSIAGFMTGLMIRQGKLSPRQLGSKTFAADPLITFVTGAIAGLVVGPRIIREITESNVTPMEAAKSSHTQRQF